MTTPRALRIVFMGTPGFAVAALNAIHASHHHVVAVVTAPDKPAGRGLKMQESAVKTASAAVSAQERYKVYVLVVIKMQF